MSRGEREEADTRREVNVGELLRRIRLRRGISVRALASETDFSPSFISQVELGQASPSIASLSRIATALGVTLSEFFNESSQEAVTVMRKSDRQRLVSSWSRAQIEALSPSGIDVSMESIMLTLDPGGHSGKYKNSYGGEVFAIVFEGEVSLTLAQEVHILHRGDAVSFHSRIPHNWENTGVEAVKIVMVYSHSNY